MYVLFYDHNLITLIASVPRHCILYNVLEEDLKTVLYSYSKDACIACKFISLSVKLYQLIIIEYSIYSLLVKILKETHHFLTVWTFVIKSDMYTEVTKAYMAMQNPKSQLID